jgi:hypothetical protein
MEEMFSGLFLALVGTALSLFGPLGPLPVSSSSPDLQAGSGNTSLKTLPFRPRHLNAYSERDCIDDTDNSDESSSGKDRTQESGGATSQSVLTLIRTRVAFGSPRPKGVSLALFYVFCTLLI